MSDTDVEMAVCYCVVSCPDLHTLLEMKRPRFAMRKLRKPDTSLP